MQKDINIKQAWKIVILCIITNPHDNKLCILKCIWLKTAACDLVSDYHSAKCSSSVNGFLVYDCSVLYVCMQDINLLWLTLKEQAVLSTDWWSLLLQRKSNRSPSLFYLINVYFGSLGRQCLFGYRQNVNVVHWCFWFLFVIQVWLISVKDHTMFFWSVE